MRSALLGVLLCVLAPARDAFAFHTKLSFTYFAWNPSDFDGCEARFSHARELGFDAVTFVPSYGVDKGDQVVSEPSGMSENAERCMLAALKLGYKVYYKPHLERFNCWKDPARANSNGCWRAWIRINPSLSQNNLGFIFNRFAKWASSSEVASRRENIVILIGAELENSLARFPKSWLSVLRDLKKNIGLPVFLSPNWQPFCKVTATECPELRSLLFEADGFSPSVYGDFYHHKVGEKIDDLLDVWSKRASCNKNARSKDAADLKKNLKAKFSVGEFGIGPSLIETESWDAKEFDAIIARGFPYRRLTEYWQLRGDIIRQWLDWARSSHAKDGLLNVWSGVHDPAGFSSGGAFDIETIKAFRSYSSLKYSTTADGALAESRKLFPQSAELIDRLLKLQGLKSSTPRSTGSNHEDEKFEKLSPWCDAR